MNKKLLHATLAGGILFFLLGCLVYGVLLMDFYEANTKVYEGLNKEMPDLLLLFNVIYVRLDFSEMGPYQFPC